MASARFEQNNWRFYENDAAEPTAALANENTKPTLADDNKLRLRARIDRDSGIPTNLDLEIQYSTNESDWYNLGAEAHWNWADGLGTEGNITTTFLLTGTDEHGKYYESSGNSEQATSEELIEVDCCIQQTANVSEGTTYYFRFLDSSSEILVASEKTHPQVLTYTLASSSPSSSPSASESASPSSSVSSSPSISSSPSSSVSASPSPSESASPSSTPSASVSSSVSASPSPSSSPSSSESASVSISSSPSATPSSSPSASESASPSSSPSATPSSSPSPSSTPSASESASPSPSESATPSSSPSSSESASPSSSPSISSSPSASISSSPSASESASPSSTPSASWSSSPSASVSASPSSSPSPSASYYYDPEVTAGCPQCGTLLYHEGESIRSEAVHHGLNFDVGTHRDEKHVRCARCGFICNTDRDMKGRRGSKEGWGIKYTKTERP